MTIFTVAATYVIVWWLVLFMALPVGIKPSAESGGRGQMAGAPERPAIGKKMLWTTLISAVVTAAIWWLSRFDIPSLGWGPSL